MGHNGPISLSVDPSWIWRLLSDLLGIGGLKGLDDHVAGTGNLKHMHTNMHRHTSESEQIRTHTRARTHTYTHTHTCTCTYTHTHTHVHTRIHTHTPRQLGSVSSVLFRMLRTPSTPMGVPPKTREASHTLRASVSL